jgi:hypothetical protein
LRGDNESRDVIEEVGGKMVRFAGRWLQPQAVCELDGVLHTLQGKMAHFTVWMVKGRVH